jgi:hypothetical protein
MADMVSTKTLPPGTPHPDSNPGRPSAAKGPNWSATFFDHLALPNGQRIGDVNNEIFREQMAAVGIEGAHSDGRNALAERYAKLISDVARAGADAAVADFLQSKKG